MCAMFRPAGFSDSDSSDQEGRQYSDYEYDQETSSIRRVIRDHSQTNGERQVQSTVTIPLDTLNNNEPPANMAISDAALSDPVLMKVLDRTKKYLRSTLLSHKGGVEVSQLNHDYMELVGEGIPYTKLKFLSLERLLRSLPTVCRIWRSGGEMMVMGVAGEASQHIQNMVSMQKSSGKGKSKSKKKGKGGRATGHGQSRMQKEMDSFHRQFAAPVQARSRSVQPPQRGKFSIQPPVKTSKASIEPVVQRVSLGGVVTEDIVVCGNRAKELLQGRLHGLYVAQVEKMYKKKFSESLPGGWSDEMEKRGVVVVVREGGGQAMVKCAEGRSEIAAHLHSNIVSGTATGLDIPMDKGVVKDRVKQLLQGRIHGLFPSQVEKMYKKQWGDTDTLDGEWWVGMEQSGTVVVDREGGQVVVRLMVNGVKKTVTDSSVVAGLDKVIDKMSGLDIVETGLVDGGGRRAIVDRVRHMGRVKQLLQGRVHGLYVAQVEKMFQKQWGESLASRWWEEIQYAGCLVVDRLQCGQVVVRWGVDTLTVGGE